MKRARKFSLFLLGLLFLQANSQNSESFVDNLQQSYSETVSRNAAQNFACGLAPVGSYYSSHFGGVDLKEHPDACGRCLQARCVDRTQCKSPFTNVTIVVIDDCPGCGVGGVSMNSLAVRELTGRTLEVGVSEDLIKIEWFLFDCSATQATVATSPPPPPPPAPAPPAPAPPAPVAVLASPEPEEVPIKEESVVSKPLSTPPAVEEEEQISSIPSPEVEEQVVPEVREIEQLVAPAPEPTPEEEILEKAVPVPEQQPPQPEISEITPEATTADTPFTTPTPAPEPEMELISEEENPDVSATGIIREATITTPAPPAPYPPPPPATPPPSAPTVEEKQQQQQQLNKQENKEEKQVGSESYYGLPGDDVLTLPRVGNVGLAVPLDFQPFPEQAFANIACGFASVSTYFKTHFAGVAASNEACGSCLAVRCADPAKCPYGTETIVQVVDTCGTCSSNDVNISPDALDAIIGKQEQSSYKDVRVTWRKVPCRGQTEGSMYLHMIDGGSNEYYAQMSLSNAAQEIQSVRINEQTLTKMSGIGGGRWEWQNNGNKLNLALPAVLEVTGMDGKVAKVELQSFNSQDLPSGGQI